MENIFDNDESLARYFESETDDGTIERMEQEIMNDKKKAQGMKEFSKLWKKSAELGKYDRINTESDWEKVRNRMGFKTKTKQIPFKKYFLRIAAIIVFAFGLAYILNEIIKYIPEEGRTDYYQELADNEIREVVLPDNTIVYLNRKSKLFYNNNFSETNRDVILEGEAYFEVFRNQNLPFKVFIGNSTVEVLGTSFNIKPSENKVTVSVLSGKVAFYETQLKGNRVQLEKNEESDFKELSNSFEEVRPISANNLAWRTGQFKFEYESFSKVFSFLEKHFQKQIIVEPEYLLTRNLTEAEFRNDESLKEILESILLGTGKEYQIKEEGNKIVVQESNPK